MGKKVSAPKSLSGGGGAKAFSSDRTKLMRLHSLIFMI